MSFFTVNNVKSILGGQWLRRPEVTSLNEPLDGVGIDTREDLTDRVFFAIKGDRHDGHSFLNDAAQRGAKLLVVEKAQIDTMTSTVGILHVDDSRRALARLALAYRRTLATTKVIGITGSSGKTTTKRLVHAALSTRLTGSIAPKSFNNDIGVPLTILAATPRDRYVVVEIATNAPGEIGRLTSIAEPDIAVITSIGRAHLERLRSIDGVAREKSAILSHMREDGLAIITADSPELRSYVKLAPSVILFGESPDGDLRLTARGRHESGGWWFEINGRFCFNLGLPGRHNSLNAIAAVAVARRMGITDDCISAGLAAALPESMRLYTERIAGIEVCNDAYNANPDSVGAALETFIEIAEDAPRRIVILGDMLELGPDGPRLHADIGRQILEIDRRVRIDHAIVVGSLSSHTAAALGAAWPKDRFTHMNELSDAAMPALRDLLHPGDSVLIKASRGAALERIVEALRERSISLVA